MDTDTGDEPSSQLSAIECEDKKEPCKVSTEIDDSRKHEIELTEESKEQKNESTLDASVHKKENDNHSDEIKGSVSDISKEECEDKKEPCKVSTEIDDSRLHEIELTEESKEQKNESMLDTSVHKKENDNHSDEIKGSVSDISKEENTGDKSNKEKFDGNHKIDESNVHYEGDLCVYTDPGTKCQYVWNESKQEWVDRTSVDRNYVYDGETYTYTDTNTNITYRWNTETNSWQKKDEVVEKKDTERKAREPEGKLDLNHGAYGFDGDTHTYTDASDGTVYFWDKEKNAWFPKVDDDFLAKYQMSYGFVEHTDKNDKQEQIENEQEKLKNIEDSMKRKAPQPPAWFEVGDESTKVYVSKLPLDITETEFIDIMQKCGLVMKDIDTGKMKVKLYMEPGTDQLKGDALCTYIKKESVDLALNLLDGYDLRGHRLRVERAKFTMKGDAYDPSLKPKKKRKKEKDKLKKMQERLFDWRPEKLRGERSKHEKVVIVKNLFDPSIFEKDVPLILEYQQDLRDECLKCGDVRRVIIYDRHPEGVAQITFKEVEAADACVQLLNNRWFCQRQITAETWDGKTNFKIMETEEEIKCRLQKWDNFLVASEDKRENKEVTSSAQDNGAEESKKEVDVEMDSDQETRSSAGSQDETDEEMTNESEKDKADVDK